MSLDEASVSTMKRLAKSGNAKMGVGHNVPFTNQRHPNYYGP